MANRAASAQYAPRGTSFSFPRLPITTGPFRRRRLVVRQDNGADCSALRPASPDAVLFAFLLGQRETPARIELCRCRGHNTPRSRLPLPSSPTWLKGAPVMRTPSQVRGALSRRSVLAGAFAGLGWAALAPAEAPEPNGQEKK